MNYAPGKLVYKATRTNTLLWKAQSTGNHGRAHGRVWGTTDFLENIRFVLRGQVREII